MNKFLFLLLLAAGCSKSLAPGQCYKDEEDYLFEIFGATITEVETSYFYNVLYPEKSAYSADIGTNNRTSSAFFEANPTAEKSKTTEKNKA